MSENQPEDSAQCSCEPQRLPYLAAVVLGMDDALVEFTGALAGFTVALCDCRLVALAGFTTGVAATLSMAASEFLSQESAANGKNPWLAAVATGIAYLLTVGLLLLPYFIFQKPYIALTFCLLIAGLIILVFTLAVARLRGINFRGYFLRMLSISFGIAAVAFLISWIARESWGIAI